MASILKVDELRGIASAGDITITSGSVTMPMQKGLTKAWLNFVDSGTASINNSENVTSLTDIGTGEYRPSWTNAFTGSNYAILACGVQGSYDLSFETNAIASYGQVWLSVGGTDQDNALGQASVTATGDLA